jgi:hypothetical protein
MHASCSSRVVSIDAIGEKLAFARNINFKAACTKIKQMAGLLQGSDLP